MDEQNRAWQKDANKRIKKYNVSCLGYKHGTPIDGYVWDCEYEKATLLDCDDCICNGGHISPITGNRCYKKKAGDSND